MCCEVYVYILYLDIIIVYAYFYTIACYNITTHVLNYPLEKKY